MPDGRTKTPKVLQVRLGANAGVHGVDPADHNLLAILRAHDFEQRPDDPRVWMPPPNRSNAALVRMQATLQRRTAYAVVLQEMPEDPARHRNPDPPTATPNPDSMVPAPEPPTPLVPVPPRPGDAEPPFDDSNLRAPNTTQRSPADARPAAEPRNTVSARPEPVPTPAKSTPVPDGPTDPSAGTRPPDPTSPGPTSTPPRTDPNPGDSNRDPGEPEPEPYATPSDAHAQARRIDEAARVWQACDDGRSPTSEHIRGLRDAVTTAHRASWVAHGVHLGDPAVDTDTPVVDPDDLRAVAEHIRTLAADIQTLGQALTAREQDLELAARKKQDPELTALRDMWRLTRRHLEAVRATVRDLDADGPRTTGWTQAHTEPPTEATPTTGSATENTTGAESVTAKPGDAQPQPHRQPQPPRPAATRTDPPTPPHPKSEFDHWKVIAPAPQQAPARNRRHARTRRPARVRDRIRDRDPIYSRDHKALKSAWETANAPRIPPQTTRQGVRDLRDQGDRYRAVARTAAKLATSPQRSIEREALHELRVAADLHARHLYRSADALDPPRRRPRPQRETVRPSFIRRVPDRQLGPDSVLPARLAEAEVLAREGVAGRDVRAKAHLHTTGPEHERLVHDIRAEHAAAHQVMRDVRDRSWWRQADPGQIAAVWQRAVEWSAHHDVAAARILRHMRGRIRQYHDVELPNTPPVNGVNLNAAIDRGHPAPAEGPTARWTYTVRDPLLHTRLLDQGEHTALGRDTPHTVGRRVLADLAARGTDPDALARAVVEIVPADRPDAKPVVVTAAHVREIGRDQANRDRAEHDLAQDAAALKSSLDNRWWEDARPVEVGWMWRAVQDWERGPARTDALDFLTDRVQKTFGVSLNPDTPAVVVTERVRENAPTPLDTTRAPERAVAAHAVRLFDRANRIEARVAAGTIPTDDSPAQLQQARSHRLRARHLAALATDPDEARHLLGAARPPAIDIDRFHHDIAAEYRRSWGRALTDDESAQLRSILERGTADDAANTEETSRPAATAPDPPQADIPASAKDAGPPEPIAQETARRDRLPRASEPAPQKPEPETVTQMPATESIAPAVPPRAPEPQVARQAPEDTNLSKVRVALQATGKALDAAPSGGPRRRTVEGITTPAPQSLPDTSVPGLHQ